MAKYDIYVECTDPDLASIRFMKFRDLGKYAVTGPGKMVMRYLKALLTEYGSDPHDPEYGTRFMSLCGGSVGDILLGVEGAIPYTGGANVLSRDEARSFMITQNSLAVDKLGEYDSDSGLEDDERLGSAEVTDLQVGEDCYDVYVYLKTAAGAPITITVSLPRV